MRDPLDQKAAIAFVLEHHLFPIDAEWYQVSASSDHEKLARLLSSTPHGLRLPLLATLFEASKLELGILLVWELCRASSPRLEEVKSSFGSEQGNHIATGMLLAELLISGVYEAGRCKGETADGADLDLLARANSIVRLPSPKWDERDELVFVTAITIAAGALLGCGNPGCCGDDCANKRDREAWKVLHGFYSAVISGLSIAPVPEALLECLRRSLQSISQKMLNH